MSDQAQEKPLRPVYPGGWAFSNSNRHPPVQQQMPRHSDQSKQQQQEQQMQL